MLSQEAFRIGLKMLEACFNVEADKTKQQIWFRLLMNVDDNDFKNAITDLCQNNTKIYPQDNIVALIIEKISELKEKAYALKLKQEQEAEVIEMKKYVRLQYQNQLQNEIEKINRKLIGSK